jgi:presenilin 1
MILTALCVIYVNTPETSDSTQAYVAFEPNEDASTATKVGLSVTNALIIVSVFCAMTFLIVLLYKYRWMKCLMGYMIISSAALLGFLGGNLFFDIIEIYQLWCDQFSYYFFLWNFALVGTGAIFWPFGGFPTWITQGYLVATSVIVAWQLSGFDSWTAWALLIMLALYDLCAVLTPCGPLKALVNLMSEDDSPDMPGLLYEAELPQDAQRPGQRRPQRQSTIETTRTSTAISSTGQESSRTNSAAASTPTCHRQSRLTVATEGDSDSCGDVELASSVPSTQESASTVTEAEQEAQTTSSATAEASSDLAALMSTIISESASTESESAPPPPPATPETAPPPPTASLPFAIAKLYKLPLQSEEPERRPSWTPPLEGESMSPNELLARQYTPEQLKAPVVAVFPRNGGRIDVMGTKYVVKDRYGNVKRILLVDHDGKVLEERQRTPEEEREEARKSNSIKLGLGDFIFYSVLVSKAAVYSFTTFIACMLVILAGLGLTLILLAVYRMALPALPISIFLGVIFYLVTRALIEPWFQAILTTPYYV